MTSLADQSLTELGGARSVLARQKRDHIELDRLIQAVDASSGPERQEYLTRLCRLVFPHAFAEESVLWPAIRRWVPEGEHLTLEIEREHQEINQLFAKLEKLNPDGAEHHELFKRIVRLLREDVRDEEDRLLPMLQRAMTRRRLVALGFAWEAVRRAAPTRPHPVVARRPPGNALAGAPLTVLDRGRDRLDRVSRRSTGRMHRASQRLSMRLARAAGTIEHVPPLTRGEDASTNYRRNQD
ncbi:cation-binding protein [Mycobacterium kubicae]|uniref:hemerythrin domain-containing protein n=1 Tax=Mycobacterium kubicae TaxID=120959 RepID=UPI0007FBFFE7|nr:hemerythrin domain-containing protein [Mycobacterium kubicae]OBF18388.1 cation-binding protein [Mycobacterium kubicae]